MILSKNYKGDIVIDISEENYEKLNTVLDKVQFIVGGLVVVAVIGFSVFKAFKNE